VRRTHPNIKFLALSVSGAPEDVIAVIRAGASGYLTKTTSAAEVLEALRLVAAGHAVFSPQLAGFVLEAFPSVDVAQVDPDLDRLTDRQREVLRHIAKGYTYKEIAEALYVSPKTIETHVSDVLRKLQLSNRHELTRWAVDRGLG
jgi:DNA-binding NarL/FixJ family response regulator